MNTKQRESILRLIDSGSDANMELARQCAKGLGDDAFMQEVEDRIYQVILAEFMRVTEPNPQPFTTSLWNMVDETTRVMNEVAAKLPPREKDAGDLVRRFYGASNNGM